MNVFSAIEDVKMLAEEKGQREKSLEIAEKIKTKGIAIEDILELTGLTKDEIEKL